MRNIQDSGVAWGLGTDGTKAAQIIPMWTLYWAVTGRAINGDQVLDSEQLLQLLQHQESAPDHLLPHSGVSLEWERALSPIFITSPSYGTRCSSVLLIEKTGEVHFQERTWHPAQETPHTLDSRRFSFRIKS